MRKALKSSSNQSSSEMLTCLRCSQWGLCISCQYLLLLAPSTEDTWGNDHRTVEKTSHLQYWADTPTVPILPLVLHQKIQWVLAVKPLPVPSTLYSLWQPHPQHCESLWFNTAKDLEGWNKPSAEQLGKEGAILATTNPHKPARARR